MQHEPASEFDDDLDDDVFLTPALLQHHLDAVAGQQVVIIATCFAGVFLSMESDRRAVYTACGEKHPLRWNRNEQEAAVRNPFVHELLSRWSGETLANLEPPERHTLADAFLTIESEFPGSAMRGHARWPDE